MEQPNVIIAEGYDSIKSEDGETGFGIYDPENKQIFIAGAVPGEIFVKALLHELMHWVQDISGCAFSEGEANTFAENIYNTMESYIVTNRWIPCSERLPDELEEVNVTWVNRKPEPYYDFVKDKPFTASAVYYKDDWYWYSSVCTDLLAECGKNEIDKIDDAIEITAWMPLPEPYMGGEQE